MYAGTRLLVLWYEEQGMPFRIRTCINHWPDGMCQSGPVLFQIRRRRGRSGGRRGGMRKEEEEEGEEEAYQLAAYDGRLRQLHEPKWEGLMFGVTRAHKCEP